MFVELVRQLGRASHKGSTIAGGEQKRISVDQLSFNELWFFSLSLDSKVRRWLLFVYGIFVSLTETLPSVNLMMNS